MSMIYRNIRLNLSDNRQKNDNYYQADFAHKIIGIGIGMLIAALGVGRVIAVFQHLFYEKMEAVRI